MLQDLLQLSIIDHLRPSSRPVESMEFGVPILPGRDRLAGRFSLDRVVGFF